MKPIEEMFEDYLIKEYPATVLSHEELVRLKRGFFAGFGKCYAICNTRRVFDVPAYEREMANHIKVFIEEKERI